MDETASNFIQNETGCNFCTGFSQRLKKLNYPKLNDFETFKKKSNSRYDAVVGVSGGVDSSYVALKAYENNINCLLVHMDNGWNTDIANENIKKIIDHTGYDFESYIIDWEEYASLQRSFIAANVIDIELLMDNSLQEVLYRKAIEHNVKSILSGNNIAGEGMQMPKNWTHTKHDGNNIKNINKNFENIDLSSFPVLTTFKKLFYQKVLGIKWERPLDSFEYNYDAAKQELIGKINYKQYQHKHHESVFTRFYQEYILLKKFNVDKLKIHLSCEIINNSISRQEAMKLLNSTDRYSNTDQVEIDKKFVLDKLNIKDEDFDQYISTPRNEHSDFN